MLDINEILQDRDAVAAGLAKRLPADEVAASLDEIVGLHERRRSLVQEVDELRRQRKEAAKAYGQARREGREPPAAGPSTEDLSALEAEEKQVSEQLTTRLGELPNLPAEDVVAGGKEANRVIAQWGEKPADAPLDHVTLTEKLGLVDFKRGVTLSGSGFWLYTGAGARLEWALIDWFIERHNAAGYTFVLPPHILLDSAGYAAGQFPKFADDVYHIAPESSERGHFLLPTSETAILGAYQDEILDAAELPNKVFAYTPCYRLEAAGSHSDERGTVRGHQFNKVEIFQFVLPDQAAGAFEEMLRHAESLVEDLGLHYQRSLLAAGDASASMRRTVDIEVWMPSTGKYKEVSSVSWAGDYQARRARLRYRNPAEGKGTRGFVHTLNGSALATSRLFPAILEQFQEGNRVRIPDVLQARMGAEYLEPIS